MSTQDATVEGAVPAKAAAGPLLDRLWTKDDLCTLLGVSEHFVYRLTSQKRIRYIKCGRELRFDPRDIAEYIDREMVPVAPGQDKPKRRPGRPRTAETVVASRGRSRRASAAPAKAFW